MDKLTYDCTYTLNNQKKHKVYIDGYLSCTGQSCELKATTGRILTRFVHKSAPHSLANESLSLGGYLIDIANPVQGSVEYVVEESITKWAMSAKKKLIIEDDSPPAPKPTLLKKPKQDLTRTGFKPLVPVAPTQCQPQPQHQQPLLSHTNPNTASYPSIPANLTQYQQQQQLYPSHTQLSTVPRPSYNSYQPQLQSYRPIPHPQQSQKRIAPEGSLILSQTPLVYVSAAVNKYLRDYQRVGVKWLFKCVTGGSIPKQYGCILMDSVGLGKSLTTIALFDSMVNTIQWVTSQKVIICCPATLVTMWQRELRKWLTSFKFFVTAIQPDSTISNIESFKISQKPHILIISYEQMRKYSESLSKLDKKPLLILDECHRIKSSANDNKTITCLNTINTQLKILLTATPVQNNLQEFYAMGNFANPGFLSSDLATFSSKYIKPIMAAQNVRNASNHVIQLEGSRAQEELNNKIKLFCLRRTLEDVDSFSLPPKTEMLLFLQPSPLQVTLTKHLIQMYQRNPHKFMILPVLNLLRKIATSPILLLESSTTPSTSAANKIQREKCARYDDDDNIRRVAPGKYSTIDIIDQLKQFFPSNIRQVQLCSKMLLLQQLVETFLPFTNIIIISNYTETLRHVQEIVLNNRTCISLDGTASQKQRQIVIDQFNQCHNHFQTNEGLKNTFVQTSNIPTNSKFRYNKTTKKAEEDDEQSFTRNPNMHKILLLSAKCAGAGLTLTNGCVQIILDANWNPAIDIQAAGRMWRFGNTRHCMSFNLITNGSIDEHILMRQIAKNDIATTLSFNANTSSGIHKIDGKSGGLNKLTPEELRKVLRFEYNEKNTYEMLNKKDCPANSQKRKKTFDYSDDDEGDEVQIIVEKNKKQRISEKYEDFSDDDRNLDQSEDLDEEDIDLDGFNDESDEDVEEYEENDAEISKYKEANTTNASVNQNEQETLLGLTNGGYRYYDIAQSSELSKLCTPILESFSPVGNQQSHCYKFNKSNSNADGDDEMLAQQFTMLTQCAFQNTLFYGLIKKFGYTDDDDNTAVDEDQQELTPSNDSNNDSNISSKLVSSQAQPSQFQQQSKKPTTQAKFDQFANKLASPPAPYNNNDYMIKPLSQNENINPQTSQQRKTPLFDRFMASSDDDDEN